DHVDGLAKPRAYCRRLRRRVDSLLDKRPPLLQDQPFPIYVEKILGHGEQLPDDWGVNGTTGYEFMNQLSLLQHDPRGEAPLSELWSEASGRSADFLDEARTARQLVLTSSLAGDVEEVAQGLLQIARHDLYTRDLTLGAIRRALIELIVHFPVYRTYAGACGRSAQDQAFFAQALEGARTTLAEADWPLLDHLDRWLGAQPLRELPPGPARQLREKVLIRFQQLTSPAAAKAVEDTACYRSGVLLSRYDVGFDPQHFSAPIEAFHTRCAERAKHFPDNLLATATHDHKRGEDSRARLAVLSERAAWFVERSAHWRELGAALRDAHDEQPAPTVADELLLYQTLLGSWPLELSADDSDGLRGYLERLMRWQEKALREAKLASNWSAPNSQYEAGCRTFLERLLSSTEGYELRGEIAAAAARIAPAGALNSLAQSLLRMSTPGVPDLYQGAEFWDFSLVDPDNRRPFAEPPEGRDAKAEVTAAALRLRRDRPELFDGSGTYAPLAARGPAAAHCLAFCRSGEVVTAVTRLSLRLAEEGGWRDTALTLPDAGRWRDLLAPGREFTGPEAAVAELFADRPVALLVRV
ncbi:MAG TPA: malto-oligosyltrehalose synthase, partial [Streptomyces sp.]|nr:malto-oligosyltrehalose synthase [Streptomyces sp.]